MSHNGRGSSKFVGWFFIVVPLILPSLCLAGGATDQIRMTVDKALVVLKDPRLKTAAKATERREQLRQILFARFDFAEMAKRSLGSNWRRRTPREQEEFVRLLRNCSSELTATRSNLTRMRKLFTWAKSWTAATPRSTAGSLPAKGRSSLLTTSPDWSATNGRSTTSLSRMSVWSIIFAPSSTGSSTILPTKN